MLYALCIKVTWGGRGSAGTISDIGGSDDDRSLPWGLTVRRPSRRRLQP